MRYILEVFLVCTGVPIVFGGDADSGLGPNNNSVVRFLSQRAGLRFATLLLVVLAMVETTDVVFAADSLANLVVSRDTFIAYYPRRLCPAGAAGTVFCAR